MKETLLGSGFHYDGICAMCGCNGKAEKFSKRDSKGRIAIIKICEAANKGLLQYKGATRVHRHNLANILERNGLKELASV